MPIADEGDRPGPLHLRWMCPYCGEAERELPVDRASIDSALRRLESHLRAVSDEAHGPAGELPEDRRLRLGRHVIVDDA